jgi:hypothetical protein
MVHPVSTFRLSDVRFRLSDVRYRQVGLERFNSLVERFCHDQTLPFKGDARSNALRT